MKIRRRAAFCLVLQILIILGEMRAIALSAGGYRAFVYAYYTWDSNLLLLLTAVLTAVSCVRILAGKSDAVSSPLRFLRYVSTCCTALTFLVVLLILAPMLGPSGFSRLLLTGNLAYMHFICPVLALISFLFAEDHRDLRFRHSLYAMIPTALYAVVIITLNVTRTVSGPYPFLLVYEQPLYASLLWFVGVLGGAWLIAVLLSRIGRRAGERQLPPDG